MSGASESISELREVVDDLVETSVSLLNADFGTVQLYDPQTGELNIAAHRGSPDRYILLDGTAAALRGVVVRRERIVIEDVLADPDHHSHSGAEADGFRAAQFTPWISRNGELLGVIASHFREPHRPSDRELRLLDLYAKLAAERIQRQNAELALAATEQRFRSLVESLPAAVYTCDASGRLTLFNQAAIDLWGRVPEINQDQWCGSFKLYRTDGTPLPLSICPMATLLQEYKEVSCGELIIERPDGTRRHTMAYPKPLRDSSGKLAGAVNMLLDITDLKNAQQALRHSEDRFRRYFELGLIGMATTSPTKGILEVNDEICRILGYERSELLQQTWANLTYPDDLVADVTQFNRVMSGEIDGYTLDKRWIRRDGTVIDTIMATNCLRRKDGSVDYFVGLVLDITERKRVETYLAYQAQLLANVHDAIVATDDKLTITAWNHAAEEIYGWKVEETLGRNVLEVIRPESSEIDREREFQVLGQTGHRHLEGTHHSRAGKRLQIEGDTIALRTEAGRITGYVSAMRDLTTRKQTEEELHKVQAELAHAGRLTLTGELAASIAHEINQPLGAIVNNANVCLRLLAATDSVTEELHEVLVDIAADAARSSAIIARLRSLVKRTAPYKEPVEFIDIVRDVIRLSGPELTERRISVRNEFPADLPVVMGDRVQIQQVLLNLVLNAIDAMADVPDTRRVLTIGGERRELNSHADVLMRVHDLGCGFDANADRLFDAFFTTKPSGLGLGLRIARSIAEAHGGRLWAEANPDYGATFMLSLPCEIGS